MYMIVITAPEYSETEWSFSKIGDARRFLRGIGFQELNKNTDPVWFKAFERGSAKQQIPVECKIEKRNRDG